MFSTPVLPAAAGFAAQNTMLPPAPTGATWNLTDVDAARRGLHRDGDVLLDDVLGQLRPDVLGHRPRLAGRVGDEVVGLLLGVEGDLEDAGRSRDAHARPQPVVREQRAVFRLGHARPGRRPRACRTCRSRRARRRRRSTDRWESRCTCRRTVGSAAAPFRPSRSRPRGRRSRRCRPRRPFRGRQAGFTPAHAAAPTTDAAKLSNKYPRTVKVGFLGLGQKVSSGVSITGLADRPRATTT